MKKKKIKKLEISKKEITILSRNDAEGIKGGVAISDFYYQTNCITHIGYDCDVPGETSKCSSTIADTELCNLTNNPDVCMTGWGPGNCRT